VIGFYLTRIHAREFLESTTIHPTMCLICGKVAFEMAPDYRLRFLRPSSAHSFGGKGKHVDQQDPASY
jgi:hypothetical protein